jgi:hypothetical protein
MLPDAAAESLVGACQSQCLAIIRANVFVAKFADQLQHAFMMRAMPIDFPAVQAPGEFTVLL